MLESKDRVGGRYSVPGSAKGQVKLVTLSNLPSGVICSSGHSIPGHRPSGDLDLSRAGMRKNKGTREFRRLARVSNVLEHGI